MLEPLVILGHTVYHENGKYAQELFDAFFTMAELSDVVIESDILTQTKLQIQFRKSNDNYIHELAIHFSAISGKITFGWVEEENYFGYKTTFEFGGDKAVKKEDFEQTVSSLYKLI